MTRHRHKYHRRDRGRLLKAFWVSECEVYAAHTVEEALSAYKRDVSITDADISMSVVGEATDAWLDLAIPDFDDNGHPTGTMTTMRAQLGAMKAPGYLCGTD